jgi:membrane-bound lytic murein transglycosylase D
MTPPTSSPEKLADGASTPGERPAPSENKDARPAPGFGVLQYQHDPKINDFMQRQLTQNRRYFEYCLERFDKVRPTMERIFMEHGLPKDLVYLAMVESGGNPNAVSPSGAVGYWQFLPGTARIYGLRVDRWVDERRDLEKSTHAAAAYLSYLHGLFGDWLLACAAYNAGEGAIRRLLNRYDHVESFWDISRPMIYKDETLAFVPKILATIKIAKDREKYGIKSYDQGTPPYDVIKVAAFTTF